MQPVLIPTSFVNIHGHSVSVTPPKKKRGKPKEAHSSHAGWRPIGIPGNAVEAARRFAEAQGVPFDLQGFINVTKRSKIVSKPYATPAGAAEAMRMAEQAGWVACEVVELRHE